MTAKGKALRVIWKVPQPQGAEPPAHFPGHSAGTMHRAARDLPPQACLSPRDHFLPPSCSPRLAPSPPHFYLLSLIGGLYIPTKLLQSLLRKKWLINKTPSDYLPMEFQKRHQRYLNESTASGSGPKLRVWSSLCMQCLHFFVIPPQGPSEASVLKVGCVGTCVKQVEDVFGVQINPRSQRW